LTATATVTATDVPDLIGDAAVLADLHVGRVDPEIGPVAFDRPLEEGLHPLVDLLAQPAHLALRDARHAERLDQIVDGTGGHTLDVGLLDHGGERLLRHAPRLQERRDAEGRTERSEVN
jgi:hypothetical protein